MGEMRDILRRDGVVRAVEVTLENLYDIARDTGGVVLDRGNDHQGEDPYAVRIPTLWGNLEAEIGDYVIKAVNTGRVEVMNAEQYRQTYFDAAPAELIQQVKDAPEPEKVYQDTMENIRRIDGDLKDVARTLSYPPGFESEEDLQAHTHRNLFEERKKNMYGRSADS